MEKININFAQTFIGDEPLQRSLAFIAAGSNLAMTTILPITFLQLKNMLLDINSPNDPITTQVIMWSGYVLGIAVIFSFFISWLPRKIYPKTAVLSLIGGLLVGFSQTFSWGIHSIWPILFCWISAILFGIEANKHIN
ncbi:hypothetical protein ACFL1A_02985 [Patescibacteria group bacterium]